MRLILTLVFFISFASAFAQVKGIEVEEVDNGGEIKGRTIRVYVVLENDSDQVYMVYGDKAHPLKIKSTKPFYQSELAGPNSRDSNRKMSNENAAIRYDSWLTIGASDNYDNGTELLLETTNFEKEGGEISTTDGAWYCLPKSKQCYPDDKNRVLLMQLTSEGGMEGTFSLMGTNHEGEIFHHYNANFSFKMSGK